MSVANGPRFGRSHGMPEPSAWLFRARLRVAVMRPEDNLILQVTADQLVGAVDEHGVPRFVPAEGAKHPRLIVGFPPQHVAEQVFQEKQGPVELFGIVVNPGEVGKPEVPALPAGARFALPSRLVFDLAATDHVELTVAGVLEAMSRLRLAVVPLAAPRQVWRFVSAGSKFERGFMPEFAPAGQPVAETAVGGATIAIERLRATRLLSSSGLGPAGRPLLPDERVAVLQLASEERIAAVSVIAGSRVDRDFIGQLLRNPDPRPPNWNETAIEVPSRLQLSPSIDGAWAHATKLDKQPGEAVELWHTRLGVRTTDPDATARVDEDDPTQRIVRAVWTRDVEAWGTKPSASLGYHPFRQSTDPEDRYDIVAQSTGAGQARTRFSEAPPVDVQKLYLSSLGAFLDVRGAWPEASVEEWQHRTTLGRDQYVKVVHRGYLFPFGHRASHVVETRRKVDPNLPESGDTAILWQRHFIIVRRPTLEYGGRGMPFTSITVRPNTTPDLDDPGVSPRFFWPRIDGAAFPFTIMGVDHDGETHSFATPLLWVAATAATEPTVLTAWAKDVLTAYQLEEDAGGFKDVPVKADRSLVEMDLASRRIHIAPKGASGEAAYETRELRFAADPQPETSSPQLLFGSLVIPAVAAATGDKTPLQFTYADEYIKSGFGPENAGEVVLKTARDAPPGELSFATSDRSGGFLSPGQHVKGVSRRLGPIEDVAKTATGTAVDPRSLFSGLGKLFGLFELGDVLGELGLDHAPAYASQLLDIAGALDGGLGRVLQMLPDEPAQVKQAKDAFDAAQKTYGALMQQSPPPIAADFQSFINGELQHALDKATAEVLIPLGRAEAAIVGRVVDTLRTLIHPPVPLPADPADMLARIAAGEPVAAMLNHVHLRWSPPLVKGPPDLPVFEPKLGGADGALLLAVDVRGGDLAPPSTEILAQLTNFSLELVPGMPLLSIGFERLMFKSSSGSKSEVDVVLHGLEWQGILAFVERLKELIPLDGFSDPPSVDVDSSGIAAGFSVGLPNLAIGVFNLSNLSLSADVKVPFIGDPPAVGFAFCSRERPFTLAVMFLGGGGFFGLRLSPNGLALLEASIEFGATLALDFGVASGSVSCMAGVYMRLEAHDGSLTGYLRIRGEVDVLGLISACIEMYMGLTYEFGSGKVIGRATITVEVEVFLFSGSVQVSCERRFAGSNGDPTFEQALGPYTDDGPWVEYCRAFAEIAP